MGKWSLEVTVDSFTGHAFPRTGQPVPERKTLESLPLSTLFFLFVFYSSPVRPDPLPISPADFSPFSP